MKYWNKCNKGMKYQVKHYKDSIDQLRTASSKNRPEMKKTNKIKQLTYYNGNKIK